MSLCKTRFLTDAGVWWHVCEDIHAVSYLSFLGIDAKAVPQSSEIQSLWVKSSLYRLDVWTRSYQPSPTWPLVQSGFLSYEVDNCIQLSVFDSSF